MTQPNLSRYLFPAKVYPSYQLTICLCVEPIQEIFVFVGQKSKPKPSPEDIQEDNGCQGEEDVALETSEPNNRNSPLRLEEVLKYLYRIPFRNLVLGSDIKLKARKSGPGLCTQLCHSAWSVPVVANWTFDSGFFLALLGYSSIFRGSVDGAGLAEADPISTNETVSFWLRAQRYADFLGRLRSKSGFLKMLLVLGCWGFAAELVQIADCGGLSMPARKLISSLQNTCCYSERDDSAASEAERMSPESMQV
ncbi:hypothetical protein V5O48_013097, partial [Marasmius crinis-equi]